MKNVARVAIVQPPLGVDRLLAQNPQLLLAAHPAPTISASWGEIRANVRAAVADAGRIADRVILIGDTTLEREWSEAGRLAGYLSSERFFS